MSDVRLHPGYWTHPKTSLLIRRVGWEGAARFQLLWVFCAQTAGRERGSLGGLTDEMIEVTAGWAGEAGTLVEALVEVGYLDGPEGDREIHEWELWQPWVAAKPERSEASKAAALARWHRNKGHAEHVDGCPECARRMRGVCEPDASRMRGAMPPSLPSPSLPSPSQEKAEPAAPGRARKERRASRDHKGMGANCVGEQSPEWWPPTKPQEFTDAPHPDGGTWGEHIAREFVAYDGVDGHPKLRDRFLQTWEFWVQDKRKGRWKTPQGFIESLRGGPPGQPDYAVWHLRLTKRRERAGLPPPGQAPTKSAAEQTRERLGHLYGDLPEEELVDVKEVLGAVRKNTDGAPRARGGE